MKDRPSDAETLRLVKAFFDVTDPEARRTITALAEAAARGMAITAETLQFLASEAKQR